VDSSPTTRRLRKLWERPGWLGACIRILGTITYPLWSILAMVVGFVWCIFWMFGPLIYIGLPVRYLLDGYDIMPLVFIPGVIVGYYFHVKLFYAAS
jgi:hypothetical protein